MSQQTKSHFASKLFSENLVFASEIKIFGDKIRDLFVIAIPKPMPKPKTDEAPRYNFSIRFFGNLGSGGVLVVVVVVVVVDDFAANDCRCWWVDQALKVLTRSPDIWLLESSGGLSVWGYGFKSVLRD